MATAFCSIQLITSVKGRSLTPTPKEQVGQSPCLQGDGDGHSLHCPRSIKRGMPSISPKSRSLKWKLPCKQGEDHYILGQLLHQLPVVVVFPLQGIAAAH